MNKEKEVNNLTKAFHSTKEALVNASVKEYLLVKGIDIKQASPYMTKIVDVENGIESYKHEDNMIIMIKISKERNINSQSVGFEYKTDYLPEGFGL